MAGKLKVFVTGGNDGIGKALCHQLARNHNIHVFLGSRNEQRGKDAIKDIMEGAPEDTQVDLVIIDVGSDESVQAAAASMAQYKPLHAVVNNAGVGLGHGVTNSEVMNVNAYGPKRVVEAFLPLVNPDGGRLIGTSSGAASGYVGGTMFGNPVGSVPLEDRAPLKDFDCTWEQLEDIMNREKEADYGGGQEGFASYGLSKAVLTAYHMLLARENPNLVCATLSPGFIKTKMTEKFGPSLEPEDGTVSLKKCILEELPKECKGWYYGSDGLRSPLDKMRNPGDPEYTGEE